VSAWHILQWKYRSETRPSGGYSSKPMKTPPLLT
jgi:hypothetical protein